ncbi:MAG TPA: PAS domain S-box protein [Burkholderiales bacterium]|jgi:PAS domain S-box-containing protein
MYAATGSPADLGLVLHDSLSDSYESSNVLLARVGMDARLQLLTSGWERVLGYSRRELNARTLLQLMWSDRRSAAAAVAQILDTREMRPVILRIRCRNGRGKCLRLHRLYDRQEKMMYIVAEEAPQNRSGVIAGGAERRSAARSA